MDQTKFSWTEKNPSHINWKARPLFFWFSDSYNSRRKKLSWKLIKANPCGISLERKCFNFCFQDKVWRRRILSTSSGEQLGSVQPTQNSLRREIALPCPLRSSHSYDMFFLILSTSSFYLNISLVQLSM